MLFDVISRRAHSLRVFSEPSKPYVAGMAEESAALTCQVIVIVVQDALQLLFLDSTDSAPTTLQTLYGFSFLNLARQRLTEEHSATLPTRLCRQCVSNASRALSPLPRPFS